MKNPIRLYVLCLPLVTMASAAFADQKNEVPAFLTEKVIGTTLCTANTEEPAKDLVSGRQQTQRWMRKAAYAQLIRQGDTLAFDYTVDVDMKIYDVDDKGTEALAATHLYHSVLRFEVFYNAIMDRYVGFARYVDAEDQSTGTKINKVGQAFAVVLALNGKTLQLTAHEVAPSAYGDKLGKMAFQEVLGFTSDAGLARVWEQTIFEMDNALNATGTTLATTRVEDSHKTCANP